MNSIKMVCAKNNIWWKPKISHFIYSAEKTSTKKDEIYTFEETVSKLGTGKFHIIILLVCGSSLLSTINESLSMGFVIPSAKCDFPVSTSQQGILNSVGFFGVLMSSHFWGFLADTWGRKKVMQASLLTTFIFSFISSFSTNVWTMIVLRFIVGAW